MHESTAQKQQSQSAKKVHFFSVSGMRGSGRTEVFKGLKRTVPITFPQHSCAFLEDPFGKLPHPLLWAESERTQHPVTRLFKCWAHLNEFNARHLKPALAAHDVVITDGYGLNAVLYATACVDCESVDNEVLSMHHGIVAARIKEQGIEPPEYFITRADSEVVSCYLASSVLVGMGKDACHSFIEKEEAIIDAYFDPGHGQKVPHMLNAALSHAHMCKEAMAVIRQRLLS
ncbi:MAG: hypothetical protein AAB421_01295 [Patescibacteria group bacterium]